MGLASLLKPLPRLSRIRTAVKTVAERLGPRLALGLLAAAVVMVLFALLAKEVREGNTQRFDDAFRLTVRGVASPTLTSVLSAITQLGSPVVLFPLTAVAALVFLEMRRIRGAILMVVTMLGVALLNQVLKVFFQRERPVPFFGLATPSSWSFPSGHAMASFCFYGALAALVTARLRSRALRLAVWAAAAVIIFAVGFSRIYLGVHYLSDVVAGYAVGFVWVLTVASADRMFRRADKRGARPAAAEPPPGGPA
jgi:membrane-associated phospholipid phosphatase